MTDEEKSALTLTVLLTLAVEGIRVAFSFVDRSLAHWQGRKEEERRRAARQARADKEPEGESYVL